MESPEVNPCIYGQLMHDKGGKAIPVPSTKSAGTTGQLYVKI